MAAYLSTEQRPTGWIFHLGANPIQLIEIGLRSKILSLQVDCDELCRAASILYSHNIPWVHQKRVVEIHDLHYIALILFHWNDPTIQNGTESFHIITE